MIAVLAAVYVAVLGAEIFGDKLLYTIGILAGRFSRLSIVVGTAAAFMVKMGAAVAIGGAIASLPPAVTLSATGATFLWVAWSVWRKKAPASQTTEQSFSAVVLSFSAVVFSEWGDLGQLTAAAMASRFRPLFVVWIGAVLAMTTKSLMAITAGARLRQWMCGRLPDALVRYASVVVLLILGTISVLETLAPK